ncbi:Probable LRR receptor-like serine/threonine-protein kinase At1g67720 [Linum perenne]
MVLLLSMFTHFLLLSLLLVSPALSQVSEFVSIDCGGTSNYSDSRTGLEWVSDATMMSSGKSVEIQNPDGNLEQYKRRRDFPIDSSKKYCYNLATRERRRYLIRATFQYGNLGNQDAYPKFDLYLDATKWSTVTILESSRVYVKEMIIRAPSTSVDVCICCATTGSPFISTLELRPLNLSMYATDFEGSFFLKVAARMNFGASNKDAIRYPDDPYDRIWDSDLDRRQNYLVGVAPGTMRINTTKDIWVSTREYPPVKVMQTAVVGTEGTLSYRLNLEDFPANARAYAYFAEIEDLGSNETRKFKLTQPYFADYSNAVVNIMENGNGSNSLYEPSYMNVSLEFVLSFSFVKTRDSTRGPLLNAMEISKYLQIAAKTDSQDLNVLNIFRSMAPGSSWTSDGGDPCVPAHWEWVTCGITSPPRITKISLSGKNLRGEIPPEINHMRQLEELWLDGNFLTGPIPDISNLVNLKIMHLENNKLNGSLPKYIASLPNLHELTMP